MALAQRNPVKHLQFVGLPSEYGMPPLRAVFIPLLINLAMPTLLVRSTHTDRFRGVAVLR